MDGCSDDGLSMFEGVILYKEPKSLNCYIFISKIFLLILFSQITDYVMI